MKSMCVEPFALSANTHCRTNAVRMLTFQTEVRDERHARHAGTKSDGRRPEL
jgi:hypothetical protein